MVICDSRFWELIWIDRRSINAIKITEARYIGLLRDKACDGQVVDRKLHLIETSSNTINRVPNYLGRVPDQVNI